MPFVNNFAFGRRRHPALMALAALAGCSTIPSSGEMVPQIEYDLGGLPKSFSVLGAAGRNDQIAFSGPRFALIEAIAVGGQAELGESPRDFPVPVRA